MLGDNLLTASKSMPANKKSVRGRKEAMYENQRAETWNTRMSQKYELPEEDYHDFEFRI
jgi:hypothetical protein